MNKEKLSEKILEKIEKGNITPTPRWHFLLKNNVFWCVWALSVLMGSLALAASIFALANAGWAFRLTTHNSLFAFLFEVIPYVWMITLIAVTAIGYYNIRKTKRGYRYPLWVIVSASLVASMVGGVVLYGYGLGQAIEDGVGRHIPLNRPVLLQQEENWVAPELGRLAGEVLEVSEAGDFTMEVFTGETWFVEGNDLDERAAMALGSGKVRILGFPVATGVQAFHACAVFPWEIYGGFEKRPPLRSDASAKKISERKFADLRSNGCEGVRPNTLIK